MDFMIKDFDAILFKFGFIFNVGFGQEMSIEICYNVIRFIFDRVRFNLDNVLLFDLFSRV